MMKRLLCVLSVIGAAPVAAGDACLAQIPATLKPVLEAAYPAYRLPLVGDNVAEDVAWSLEHKGTACLGVARGDFTGNGRKSWIIGLTQKGGKGALVVVALPSLWGKWQLHALATLPGGRTSLYVAADKPGTWNSAGEEIAEEGQVRQLVCPHEVAVYGAMESSSVAYCYNRGAWKHVWFSD